MGGSQMTYSVNPDDYKLLEEVGYGASATVYRAIYLPFNDVVAVKCLDLDRCNSNLDDIRREAQTMRLIDHPNVIRAFCSFVVDQNLWVVMPYMDQGSCLHLMKIAYQDGFEEAAIGSILKETLKALEYLHRQGHIHRDVKAGNILLNGNGEVKLADFGVSACMFDTGDRQRARNTFVGTPCWMAPEVLQPGSGYNSKADIWSFGITALELAHGHAPFSKYPPMKVLLMTIQNAPPGLDYDRDKKFSKSFKEMVAMCLVKDQTKRPTAEKLLKHSFFKHAKPPELSVKKLFADLPSLWNRVKALQLKDAAQLALKKMPSAEQEALSQSEYQRGVSAWNFDLEDLKAQASLVRDDDDDMPETREEDECMKQFGSDKSLSDGQSSSVKLNSNSEIQQVECRARTGADELSHAESLIRKGKLLESDTLETGIQEKFGWKKNDATNDEKVSTSERDMTQDKAKMVKGRQSQSGPLVPGAVLGHSLSDKGRFWERSENDSQPITEKTTREVRKAPSFVDIPLSTVPRRSSQGSPLRKSASVGDWIFESKQTSTSQSPKEISNSNLPASLLMPYLQNLFQQTSIQQDLIVNLFNSLQPAEAVDAVQNGKLPPLPRGSENNGSVEAAPSERERLLLMKISELQARMINLTDELNSERLKYVQRKVFKNNGICRAEFSRDAPFAAAIGVSMLSSLFLPNTARMDEDGDSAIDSTDARLMVMGIISFIPYFNWLSWVFAWLDTGKRRYAVYAFVYMAPYLRSNMSLSPEESWLPVASIVLGIIHVQLEASIKNGDLEGFQLFNKASVFFSSMMKRKDINLKEHEELFDEGRQEPRNLPSAEEQLRDEIREWRAPRKPSEHHEPSNGDWDNDDQRKQ
ncbi:hypothetical protein GH714_011308 [Hevea brasiliensis]|uniref:Protein kinase domain-containing protein n=1 Tax=Hevea brasiliensis TaxID=3981 RepID=A0A6A6MNF1_HEVBR|nr:hypothetical protein GH714_011308 [Hevea brasiliensis]